MKLLLASGTALLLPLTLALRAGSLAADGELARAPLAHEEIALAWTPRAGVELAYTLAQEVTMELVDDDLVLLVDGEPDEDEYEGSEHTAEHALTIRFTDRLAAVDDAGRLTELVRTFDEIAGEVSSRFESDDLEEDFDDTLSSPLEGLAVRFTRDGDEWSVAWAGGAEGDDALLEHLDVEASLAAFLPEKPVSEGDAWDAGAAAFRAVYEVGGDLAIGGEEDDEESLAFQREAEEAMLASLAGSVRCAHAGLREVDGRKLCAIAIEVDLAGETTDEGTDDVDGTEYVNVVRTSYDLAGTLLWDVEAGRATSLELSGKGGFETEDVATWTEDGEQLELRSRDEYELAMRFAYTIEAR